MTKKYKFNFYNGLGTIDSSEIVELSEHLNEQEIDLESIKWLFGQLDANGIGVNWNEVSDD